MYIAHALEELYGVPEIKVPSPFGVDWTDKWIRAVAKVTNKEDKAEAFIAAEHKRIEPELNEFRELFQGKTVYVWGGDAWALNIANMVKEFGMKLVGVTLNHHDVRMDTNTDKLLLDHFVDDNGNVQNISICNKQPFIVHKLLTQISPDVIILRHTGNSVVCAKTGIPALHEGDVNYGVGYEGILHLGRRIRAVLKKKRFFEHVGKNIKIPYTDWWLNEADPFYFEGVYSK
jgi:nitrogenase molybdenum-iron protein alpha chain